MERWSQFFKGMGSVLLVQPKAWPCKRAKLVWGLEADREQLCADWRNIGHDFAKAFERGKPDSHATDSKQLDLFEQQDQSHQ